MVEIFPGWETNGLTSRGDKCFLEEAAPGDQRCCLLSVLRSLMLIDCYTSTGSV